MEESWQVVSPSSHEALCRWGKLADFIFNSSPSSLVLRFAVPVPPPNGHSSLSYRESQTHNDSDDTLGVEARPTFSSLPVELHELIFEALAGDLDIESITYLGLTNKYFSTLGRRHLHKFFLSHVAHWARQSIICVGSRARKDDYPPGVLQDLELRRVLNLDDNDASKHISLHDFIEQCEAKMDISSIPLFKVYHEGEGPTRRPIIKPFNPELNSAFPKFGPSLLKAHKYKSPRRGEYYKLSRPLETPLTNIIHPMLLELYPQNQPWILRNITTREYVRAEAIALKPEYIHGPEIDHVGFGEVIISRVCWSVDEDPAIGRGKWAGHRFDITTFARHEQETVKEKEQYENGLRVEQWVHWKDVSDEVAEEITSIWELWCGPDWWERHCQEKF